MIIEIKNYEQKLTIIDCENDILISGGIIKKRWHKGNSLMIECENINMEKFKTTYTYKKTQ